MVKRQLIKEFYQILPQIEKDVKEKQGKLARRRLPTYDFVGCVLNHADAINVIDGKKHSSLMFKDYYSGKYTSDFTAFAVLVDRVAMHLDQVGAITEKEFYKNYLGRQSNENVIKQLEVLPYHYIPTTFGCYNVFTQKYISKAEEDLYYIPHKFDVDLMQPVDTNHLNYKIRNVLFDNWSNHNSRANEALRFFQYCSLIGYGGRSLIFLTGSGGNGKSTYEEMTANLAGSAYSSNVEIPELMRDDIAVKVGPHLKLIYGKELPVPYTMHSELVRTFKEYVEGTSWNISRKYLSSISVYSKAVKMQATNELPKIIGLDNSVHRRLLVIDFGNVDYSKTPNEELQKLTSEHVSNIIADKDFLALNMQALINEFKFSSESEILDEYAKVREILKSDYDVHMANSHDDVEQFLIECEDSGVFSQEIIPAKCMYDAYKRFVKENNAKSGILSHAKFSTRLAKFLYARGFVLDSKKLRTRTLKSHQFNYKEFTFGAEYDVHDNRFNVMLSGVSTLYRNMNPTSFLYQLYKKVQEDDHEYQLAINEIAVENQLNDTEFFELSQNEMLDLDAQKKS